MSTPGFLADPALRRVLAALPGSRVVGGAVRDALLGRPVSDIDFATPELPERVIERLRAEGLHVVPTGLDHGTVTAVTESGPFEITTLRRDEDTDGRHAVVAFTDDWREDAARRDFTINAMSMDAAGTLFDYFGGADDLHAGRVRFVGDAWRRIAEDYLRILRFFRFWTRYGRGAPDAEAVAAIRASVGGLDILSPERVWSELRRILSADDPCRAARLMADLGVLASILPAGADPEGLGRLLAEGAPPDPLLRLAALSAAPPEAFVRLRLSGDEQARLAAWRPAPPSPAADDDALRRALADAPPPAHETLLARSWLHGGRAAACAALRERLAALPVPVFPLAGRDVLALGVPPGPRVGEALRAVRHWWLCGGCRANADACRTELCRWVAEHAPD